MRQLEVDSRKQAIKHIINMLQTSGRLEKIEQYKRTLVQKKASVKALLKSGMQSKLDGVGVGLNQLALCLHESIEVAAK